MVVADTSFLFSLYGGDSHTVEALAWARTAREPIAITPLNRYEFVNAIRFAAFRKLVSPADAQSSLAAFSADLQHGLLRQPPCDLTAVLNEAERLSALYTAVGGHRSFDILHVASARILNATTFLTFDANQRRLAHTVRLTTGP